MSGNSPASPPHRRAQVRQASPAAVAEAAEVLQRGGLVALPTETVYGLAARADDERAVAGIYRAKGRPSHNPLIVHVSDSAHANRLAHFDARAIALAGAFWPGPLTLVLPRREGAALAAPVSAGLPTVALRCPAHPVMRGVLAASGLALAAPSANRSGLVSPTTAQHAAASLGDRVDLILDGGKCATGLESTIVALRPAGWEVLRPGPVSAAQLADVLGEPPTRSGTTKVEAPGQLASHYAPGKPVRLNAVDARPDEFHIGFGDIGGALSLSPSGDLTQAAAGLYSALHRAAASPLPRIAVAPIPDDGVGIAINDRLRRAAA